MSEIRNVLLIDSDPAYAEFFRSALLAAKNGSFQGEWLGTLTEGIERLRKKGIWAIFVNLSLPDSQGIDTFNKVARAAPGVPIVEKKVRYRNFVLELMNRVPMRF